MEMQQFGKVFRGAGLKLCQILLYTVTPFLQNRYTGLTFLLWRSRTKNFTEVQFVMYTRTYSTFVLYLENKNISH